MGNRTFSANNGMDWSISKINLAVILSMFESGKYPEAERSVKLFHFSWHDYEGA